MGTKVYSKKENALNVKFQGFYKRALCSPTLAANSSKKQIFRLRYAPLRMTAARVGHPTLAAASSKPPYFCASPMARLVSMREAHSSRAICFR